ncbi:response regulator [Sandarakinorhabdus oryzae]|uniref:response regulator n=1 Tax=Sandarakinorhabdus oryzae TaxID=2675220 RepID=UPI0012E17388|nr:response regulator transcription factor [Sandarakinorhabdus oryzae]
MASIIIADDHPIMLSGIESVLTGAGHVIAARAGTGEGALAAGEGDLFLLDLRMPGGSGLDVLRALRKRGDRRPVILLTSAIDTPSLREALALDVSGLVLKGSTPAQLVLCIEQVLRGQRWMDPTLFDQAMAASDPANHGPLGRLSQRELAIVRLVVEGMRNRDIGQRLGMTEGNVKVTLHRVYERLGVSNRVEMAMLARDLLDVPRIAA